MTPELSVKAVRQPPSLAVAGVFRKTVLSQTDFVIAVKFRMGVDIRDARGCHTLSCMSGHEAVTTHNQVRDISDTSPSQASEAAFRAQGLLRVRNLDSYVSSVHN